MRLTYVLYGFGVLFSVAGVSFLAAEYVKYMSEVGKLLALLLAIGMFSALTKHFEGIGW